MITKDTIIDFPLTISFTGMKHSGLFQVPFFKLSESNGTFDRIQSVFQEPSQISSLCNEMQSLYLFSLTVLSWTMPNSSPITRLVRSTLSMVMNTTRPSYSII
jgi:hypothetical protein